ncbi:MAG: transporter related protein [Acidimicrobiales bacterium]|nr:transporter related protein [Acidimicrobiales bacterium]
MLGDRRSLYRPVMSDLAGTTIPVSPTAPLRELWRHARRHRRGVILATIFSTLNKACDVAPELLIGAAVDVVVNKGQSFVGRLFGIQDRFEQLTVLAVITVVVWLAESITEYVARVTWRNLAQTLEHDLRMEAYAHVQNLEMAYFEDRSSGGLMAVLNDDVNQLERFLDVGAHDIITTAMNVVFVGITFAVISPKLTVLAFLPIPVIIAGSLLYQKRLQPKYDAVRDAAGRIADTLTNNLGGIATIKAFTAEHREVERVRADSQHYREANNDAIRLSTAFIPLIRTAILAGFTMTLLFGGRAALRGTLDVGLFSVLVYMTQRLLWPLTRLGETLDLYQRAMASSRRIFGLLEVSPQIAPARTSCRRPCAARCGSTACASPTGPRAARSCTASTSTCRRARPTPSSARPEPARARSSSCSCACTSRPVARSPSTTTRSPTSRSRRSATHSAS